ncbi:MAG: carbohydrate ABC transporter permease [Chloroflexia bacterium]|nr:carbohydrate ABC transporter permease [Chloroflexia bacterium]
MARWRRPGQFRRLVTYLVLTVVCLIWIYPLLWMISASFKTEAEIFSGLSLIPDSLQWENFRRAWVDANIGDYFINTVIVTISSVVIVVVTTATMGYVLGRHDFIGKRLIIGLLGALVFLPQGYTIIPVFDLITALRLDGSLLGIILAQSGSAPIIMILLFAGYFRGIPRELEESAVLDGASFPRVFFQIMLPLSKPVIATTIILQFIASWNDFLVPLVLTLSRPELRTLAVGVYSFQGENFTSWTDMAAASTISLAPVIIVFLFLQRYFIEGMAGAVKQ